MRTSLVSREVIADSIELVARGHLFDGLVCVVGCDKTNPAAIMAVARLDIPSVILYSGSIAPGQLNGREVSIGDVYEGIGAYSAGTIDAGQLFQPSPARARAPARAAASSRRTRCRRCSSSSGSARQD